MSFPAALPDGYLPRRKDKVLVLAEVKYDVADREANVFLDLEGNFSVVVDLTAIKSLVSRKWEVGERVLFPDIPGAYDSENLTGEIVAVHGDFAWVVSTRIVGGLLVRLGDLLPAPTPTPEPTVMPEAPAPEAAPAAAGKNPDDDMPF